MNYIKNLEKFDIVAKSGDTVPFSPNEYQKQFINEMSGKDVILKSRQIGFSSLILGIFAIDFLTTENSRSVCISHDRESAQRLLARVKFFIDSAERKGLAVKLKYNSKSELFNSDLNSSFYIGQAGSKAFGRGDTLNNLLLSEFAMYPDPEVMLTSVLQAVVPGGKVIIESTANGMNYFKSFWDKTKAGETGFKHHFFDNSFYSKDFLDEKLKELGEDNFKQEYPSTDTEAFLSSGNPFFDREALQNLLKNVQEPLNTFGGYYDLYL